VIGLRFESRESAVRVAPHRADVACFVGWVDQRSAGDDLREVPVPVTSFEAFDRLFAWDRRPGDSGAVTLLGHAVGEFFAAGGRLAYVVRRGGAFAPDAPLSERTALLRGLEQAGSADDRRSWTGIGHLWGLPEVSFLVVPDLPELAAGDAVPLVVATPPRPAPEVVFGPCSAGVPEPEDQRVVPLDAPRLDVAAFRRWGRAVRRLGRFVAAAAREVQVVAALPLSEIGAAGEVDPVTALCGPELHLLDRDLESGGIASSFVQLVGPWRELPGTERLPGGVAPADGLLTGLLAANALARGTFRSVAGTRVTAARLEPAPSSRTPVETVAARVSWIHPRPAIPGGHELLSDVTTSLDPGLRPASVGRLVATVVRAARRLGERWAFESSGEALWRRLAEALEGLLGAFYRLGALAGATPAEAFDVACGRDTMTQNDIDQGRVVARVRFEAAAPVTRLVVVLALDDGGSLTLAGLEAGALGEVAA
jgi:hypothetical protein